MEQKESHKTYWIINQYCGSRIHGMNFRSWYFANELKKKGHAPYIITGAFSHLLQKLPEVKGLYTYEEVEGVPYTWVKLRKYKGSQSIGRILGMIEFMIKLFFFPKKSLPKPDVILVSSLSPFPVLNAYFWSKRYNAKLLFEVRDIWPLTLIEIGGMSKNHPLSLFFGWFEKFAYKKADKVISLLPKANEHMVSRGMDPSKFVCIPNGFNPEDMDLQENLDDSYFQDIPKDKFIVGYAGSLGLANAMDYLLESAKLLESKENIHFVIVGKGQHKERLIKKSGANVTFLDPVQKNEVQSVLKRFDLCYIGWHDQKIYRFGISPNKIFDYSFAAKPILHSVSAGNDLVQEAKSGLSVAPENAELIKETIEKLASMSADELAEMGKRGKEYIITHHTFSALCDKLIKSVEE